MIVNSNDNDTSSDELFSNGLQLLYNAFEDKEEFWNNKIIFRCIMGGFLNKPNILISIFNNEMIEEILNRFEKLINNNIWCTVYDYKLGMNSILKIIKSTSNENLKKLSMKILSILCNNVNNVIEHREKLTKICNSISNNEDLGNDGEFGFDLVNDDEYEELDKVSCLDKIDIFSEIKTFLNNNQIQ